MKKEKKKGGEQDLKRKIQELEKELKKEKNKEENSGLKDKVVELQKSIEGLQRENEVLREDKN